MSREWIEEELGTADWGDQRLNDRFVEVVAALSERPNVSIPAACGGYVKTVAAYRFFDNEMTTFEKIIKTHYKMTRNPSRKPKSSTVYQWNPDMTENNQEEPTGYSTCQK